MTRRFYAVLTRMDMPIIPYHVHAFDSAARRDAWCAGPVPRGFDARPATAHAALRADVHGRHGRWTEGAHAPRHRGADVAGVP